MKLHLFTCNCESNRLYKDNFLYNDIALDCIALFPLDRDNPTIDIEYLNKPFDIIDDNNNIVIDDNNNDISYSFDEFESNYCYIEELKRSYFIDKFIYLNNKIMRLYLSIDPLMSFNSYEWVNKPLFIQRRTNGDSSLIDNMIPFKSRPRVYTMSSDDRIFIKTNISFDNALNNNNNFDDSYRVVVSTLMIQSNWWLSNYEGANKTSVANGRIPIANKYSNNANMTTCFNLITPRQLRQFLQNVVSNDDLRSFVRSIIILPYEPEKRERPILKRWILIHNKTLQVDGEVYDVKYGNNDVITPYEISVNESNNFYDFSPYTQGRIYLPFVNYIDIDFEHMEGDNKVYYYTNYVNNESSYFIYNETIKTIVASGGCKIGVSIPIDTTNAYEKNMTDLFNAINGGLNLIGNMSNIIGNGASGNVGGAFGSYTEMFKDFSSGFQTYYMNRLFAQVSVTDSNQACFMPLKPFIEYSKLDMIFTHVAFENFKNNIGLLFNDYEYISNIGMGEHIIIGDTSDIDMSGDMSSVELNLLKQALENGFYK